MKIGSCELPDKCPDNCLFRNNSWEISQGGMCFRCPIMNCTPFDYEGEEMCLIRPDDYRPDWAKEWAEFFETGKIPELRFSKQD